MFHKCVHSGHQVVCLLCTYLIATAICADGEKVGLSACNRDDEGSVRYLNGTTVTCSGGACVGPNECTGCNEGYYSSNDGYCRGMDIAYSHKFETAGHGVSRG